MWYHFASGLVLSRPHALKAVAPLLRHWLSAAPALALTGALLSLLVSSVMRNSYIAKCSSPKMMLLPGSTSYACMAVISVPSMYVPLVLRRSVTLTRSSSASNESVRNLPMDFAHVWIQHIWVSHDRIRAVRLCCASAGSACEHASKGGGGGGGGGLQQSSYGALQASLLSIDTLVVTTSAEGGGGGGGHAPTRSMACLPDTDGTGMTMSAGAARPTSNRPLLRSIVGASPSPLDSVPRCEVSPSPVC